VSSAVRDPQVRHPPESDTGYPHVEVRDGRAAVAGSRVLVSMLWSWHRRGVSVETLVKRHPTLGWAKIMSALAYAHDHEAEIEADLARQHALLGVDPEPVPGRMRQVDLPFRDPRSAIR
jgi:uncharacterized protein (DUF433 family)